jgi:glycosyltransferase 2 family protein
MKALPIAAVIVGVTAMAVLVAYFGAGAVMNSLAAIGLGGFIAVCGIHLALTAAMGLAWRALLPGASTGRVMWARLVRDSGSEALPLSQVGGYVLGVRALALAGVPATLGAASTIVDVTLEFVAQLAYTAIGLVLLVQSQPETQVAIPVLLGLAVAAAGAGAFVLVQHRGLDYFDRLARMIGRDWIERGAAGAAALHGALAGIYRNRTGLWVSFALHLVCWIASAVQVWVVLQLAGQPLPFSAVLAIESLLYAIRTAAFVVPQAVGVQEAAYVLLGAGFGLTPDMSLALSLLKRGRDLAIGLPAIAIWQTLEGRALWRRHRTRKVAMPPAD